MAGPWEKYQNTQSDSVPASTEASGPWASYASGNVAPEPKMTFKGLLENAAKNIESYVSQIKEGVKNPPTELADNVMKMAQGDPRGTLKIGQTVAKAIPGVVGKVGEILQDPLKAAYENPVDASLLAYGAGKGALSLGKSALSLGSEGAQLAKSGVSKFGAAMESAGAKGQNYAAGIRPQTIEAMTRAGQNPGEVGVKVGSRLAQEKIVGQTPTETFNNLMKARQRAGSEVSKALRDVHGNGTAAINADKALQPLLEAVKERSGAITSARRAMAKPFEQVYNYLVKSSSEDGMLSLDQIKKAMKEVGPMTHKGSEEVQAAMAELYGTLANVQDNIVSEIATKAKNPALKASLLKANEKYSLYSRIMPDIEKAAAKESVGKASFIANPIESIKKTVSTNVSGVMNRFGSKLKGFPITASEQNKIALENALKRSRGQ